MLSPARSHPRGLWSTRKNLTVFAEGNAMSHEYTADKAMLEDISTALSHFEKKRKNVIPILQMIQEEYAYLAPDSIKLVADYLGMAPCEIYGVATFYNQFRFHPPGKHQIKVCLGTACHVKGGDIIPIPGTKRPTRSARSSSWRASTPVAPFSPVEVLLNYDCTNIDPAPVTNSSTSTITKRETGPGRGHGNCPGILTS